MIPNSDTFDMDDEINEDLEEVVIPSKTYKLNAETKSIEKSIDGIDAMKQAIYKIVMTETETYPIYGNGYGVMLADLIGQPIAYAQSMAEHRIEEAILNDDRFETVTFTSSEYKDGKLTLDIEVGTTDDATTINLEGVEIDV